MPERSSAPIPTTVSPEMQALIAAPFNPIWKQRPTTAEGWKSLVDSAAARPIAGLPGLCDRLQVRFERTTVGGARAFAVTPKAVAPRNANRLLIHIHGGCYVLNPGEAGLPEAIYMAAFGGFRVLSVDYRMPPEAFFPSALDDCVSVWKSTVETTDPTRTAVFGTSAGGALTLALMLRAKQEGLPLPAAIASGTPMSDVTKTGDTFYTNELLDNVLVSRDGFCDAATRFYANGHDLADPAPVPRLRRPERLSSDDLDERNSRPVCSATRFGCIASSVRRGSRLHCKSMKANRTRTTSSTIQRRKLEKRSRKSRTFSTAGSRPD